MNAETLRDICLPFPHAAEEIKWGDNLVFSVAGKMFCMTSFEEPFHAAFKVDGEAFGELCIRQGVRPAPYLARAGWVQVSNEARLGKPEWESLLKRSYELVCTKLTKKQKAGLGL